MVWRVSTVLVFAPKLPKLSETKKCDYPQTPLSKMAKSYASIFVKK